MTAWFAAHALLPNGLARDVRFEIADGRFTAVTPGGSAQDATTLPGVVLPGLANGHSHAFHRALRGRTHADGGSFWTWRTRMYVLASQLDPERYLALARGAYAEMVSAGITTVGEFHYLHHDVDGQPYAEPNVMAEALRAAAREAGLRLTLLDACYLHGGLDADGYREPDEVQRRFADRDAEAWAERQAAVAADDTLRTGVAVHSVRAVDPAAAAVVNRAAAGRPLHAHLSEQPAENEACEHVHGATPAAVLDAAGVLGPATTVVHATHLTGTDITLLGRSGTTACFCPTTERDLADGIGPARALADSGARLALGTDQHAVVDMFEEARALEMHERLQTGRRGCFTPAALLDAATRHDALGWPDAGRLEPGARADLVAVRVDSVRTAGAAPDQIVFAAGAADVDTVVVDGRPVVRDGRHVLGDVGRLLRQAISSAWGEG